MWTRRHPHSSQLPHSEVGFRNGAFPSCAGATRTPHPGHTHSISRTPRAERTLAPLEGRALGTSSWPGQVQRLEQACLLTLDSRERHGFLVKSTRTIYGHGKEFT